MKIRSADLERIFDLSTNGVKLYEKQGIISPKRQAGNNYRVYSVGDLQALGYSVQFRRFGFSLQEASGLLNEKDLPNQIREIEAKADQLQREIEALERKRKCLLESADFYRKSLELQGICRMETAPSLYFFGLRRGEEWLSGETREMMSRWISAYSPHTMSAILLDGPYLTAPDFRRAPQYGIAVSAITTLQLGLQLSPLVSYIQPKPCVATAFELNYDHPDYSDVLARVRSYSEEHGLEMFGGGISLLTGCRRQNGEIICTCLLWAPLKESENQYGSMP